MRLRDALTATARTASAMIRAAVTAIALVAALLTPAIEAQQPSTATPPAQQADISSPEAIVAALYDVISGPQGEERNWDRMRSLFVPGARLMPVGPRPDGGYALTTLTVDEYITRAGPRLVSTGFTEREIARTEERFGNIMHVFSTYEGEMATGAPPIRGINSIQLMFDGKRWWVVTVFWEAERPDNPIPAQYLPNR